MDKEIIQQDLSGLKDSIWNPLKNFVFGGIMYGDNMKVIGTTSGSSLEIPYEGIVLESGQKTKKCRIDILMHSAYESNSEEFEGELLSLKDSNSGDIKKYFAIHQKWWEKFWQKSWIMINNGVAVSADSAWQVGRNYNIFR